MYCRYLSPLDKLEGAGLQLLASQSSRGELIETIIYTQGAIVNMRSPVNSNALQLDGYDGAIKAVRI